LRGREDRSGNLSLNWASGWDAQARRKFDVGGDQTPREEEGASMEKRRRWNRTPLGKIKIGTKGIRWDWKEKGGKKGKEVSGDRKEEINHTKANASVFHLRWKEAGSCRPHWEGNARVYERGAGGRQTPKKKRTAVERFSLSIRGTVRARHKRQTKGGGGGVQ